MSDALAAPVLAAAGIGFVVLFFTSTRHKISQWQVFRFVVDDYRLVPTRLGALAAFVAVGIEVALLLGWALVLVQSFGEVVFVAGLARPVALATAGLIGFYGLAMLSLVLRGRVHVDCGCSTAEVPVSYRLIIRNGAIAAIALFVASTPVATLDAPSLLVGVGGALVGTLIYATVNQLARNAAEQSNWMVSKA